jgi:hypothetical protein
MNDKENFDEDLIEKAKSMSKEEMEKFFLSMPREKGAEYKEIYVAVMILEDLYYVLTDLPIESFKSEFVKKIKEVGGNPADRLKDYILLEIRKFYELAFHEKRYTLPKLPDYWEKIKSIRDQRIAHPDKKNQFKSNEDVERLYRAIDEVGFDKIFNDFKKYAKECLENVCDY